MGARVWETYETQLQHLRVIHADQHPGNFLFQPNGRFGLVDFGCVKRINFDILEVRSFYDNRGWRESKAAEQRFLSIIYGKTVSHARGRKLLPLMEEMLDLFQPQVSADVVINWRKHRQNSRIKDIQRRMGQMIWRDKLINPDFAYLSRADMGIWHLLGEIGATVNVSEISRRVAATSTAAR